jgi:hypothetical protein
VDGQVDGGETALSTDIVRGSRSSEEADYIFVCTMGGWMSARLCRDVEAGKPLTRGKRD